MPGKILPTPPKMPMPRPAPNPPQPRRPAMPSYKKGGIVKKTGPALVHAGEKIIPVKKKTAKKK